MGFISDIVNFILGRENTKWKGSKLSEQDEKTLAVEAYIESLHKFINKVWKKLNKEEKLYTLLYLETKGHNFAWFGLGVIFESFDADIMKMYKETPIQHPISPNRKYIKNFETGEVKFAIKLDNETVLHIPIDEVENYIKEKKIPVDEYFSSPLVQKGLEFLIEIGYQDMKKRSESVDKEYSKEKILKNTLMTQQKIIQTFNLNQGEAAIMNYAFYDMVKKK